MQNTSQSRNYEDGETRGEIQALEAAVKGYKTKYASENVVNINVVTFKYNGAKGQVWGYQTGRPIDQKYMDSWKGHDVQEGDIGIAGEVFLKDGTYEPLHKTKDPTILAGDTHFIGVVEITFFPGEHGQNSIGHRPRGKGYKNEYDFDKRYITDKSWAAYAEKVKPGDKYKVIITNIDSGRNTTYCLPVECTHNVDRAKREYALARAEAISRGKKLVIYASDNVHGGVFYDDNVKENEWITYNNEVALLDHPNTKTITRESTGSSYPGLFEGKDLLEIDEDQYQLLREERKKLDKVESEIDILAAKGAALDARGQGGSAEFKEIVQKIKNTAGELGIGPILQRHGNMFWKM